MKIIYITLIFTLVLCSCKKYLDKEPDKALTIPTSLNDFRLLLENPLMDEFSMPARHNFATDDLMLIFSAWQAGDQTSRNSYVWAEDVFQGNTSVEWNNAYNVIYYANLVLDGLGKNNGGTGNEVEYNNIKGTALFYRALAHFNIQEMFGNPYKKATASSDLGIPLKLNSNLEASIIRSSVEETYDKIISDLMDCKDLVPVAVQSANLNRPCKPAVFGLLARVYLYKQDYENAKIYADSCLNVYNTLLDYNNSSLVKTSGTVSFPSNGINNPEVMFWSTANLSYTFPVRIPVDTNFYKQYSANDIRKTAFFRINPTNSSIKEFKGSYSGNFAIFTGVSTDEVYLIAAECNARLGNASEAMNKLNFLLIKRWVTGTFSQITASDPTDALNKVLIERRKELIFRSGLRWSDLRRLNQDPNYSKTIQRDLNGQTFIIAPNDPKYAFPIPPDVVRISGVQQNDR